MAANVQDANFLTRRGVVAAAIIALHVLAAWGFASGLATKAIEALAPPIEATLEEEVKQEDEPPPPPPPEMERPPVEVPPPEVSIDLPMETNTTAIQDVTDKQIPLPPPPPKTVPGQPARMTRPVNPDDFYPPGSIRREEQGSPVVQACVGPNGRLLREPVVTDTSGFPDLDGAAVKVAKATRYAAGSEGGTALAESCIKFKVKFVLKNN
jgi:periplasmic protein TonB